MRAFALTLMALLALVACSAPDVPEAQAGVQTFHAGLDAKNYADIYRTASDDLKDTMSEGAFTRFLAAVHDKLGMTQHANFVSKSTNITTHGSYITLIYRTAFSDGSAEETFVFVTRGHQTLLAGYYMEPMALMKN